MPTRLEFVTPIREGSEDLDQYMIAAKPKRRGPRRHAGSGAFELMGEDRAAGRHSSRHGVDEGVYAAGGEAGKPACLHESPLPVDDIGVERAKRALVGC